MSQPPASPAPDHHHPHDRHNHHHTSTLRIDSIVASHPELGPSPPDGGWGWIVLACSIIVQITVPSVTIAYGVLVLYENLQNEYEENERFHFWDRKVVMVPVSMLVFSLLSASWSKTIVAVTNRPRIVAIAGVFLISAGILISSIGIDTEEDALIFNIFAGMTAGIGTSLTEQQSETLLRHYFRNKLNMVLAIYKTSTVLGSIIVSIVIGTLCTQYDLSFTLILYAGIIFLNSIILVGYTRPTYIMAPLQKKYRELREESEDDEEIYSSQAEPTTTTTTTANEDNFNEPNQEDNEQDEEVISTFNSENVTREVVRPKASAISRLDSPRMPYIIEDHTFSNTVEGAEQPSSLYRETTIAYGEAQTSIFTFEPTPVTAGTARRTEHVRKNMITLFSTLRDLPFYVYTYINFNVKLSMLVLGLFLPAYASQEIPDMDMIAVVFLVVIIYIGAGCMGIVVAFLPSSLNRKFFLALFSLLSFFGLIVLGESHTKVWIIPSGMLAVFSVAAVNTLQRPICGDVKIEKEAYVISMTSNCIAAALVMIVTMMGSYEYAKYFRIAGLLHMISPILIAIIRKSP